MSSTLSEGTIVGFGDPLLDITANVDVSLLEKFKLGQNDSVPAGPEHAGLSEQLCRKYAPRYTAGGSTQNTLRVLQWILRQPRISTMIGAIGFDQFGRYLEQNARECGVDIRYHYDNQHQTGTCCVLVTKRGMNRSLVTTKGAAAHYSEQHLHRVWDSVERAKFFYVTSYFLCGNLETVLKVAHHSRRKGKVMCLNLSAPFLMDLHREKITAILPYVDIIFGNESELDAFLKSHSKQMSRREGSKFLSTFLAPVPRVVVITCGNEPVIVANGGNLTEYPISKIDPDSVVDTNGAGDAFVGGFLAFLIKGCSIDVCVKNGCLAALAIIQELGCTTPERSKVEFTDDKFNEVIDDAACESK
ncbi:adenosine kinase isoform X2 [Galendromus occidentalis]|uniref:Adenosine kinase n=1 Tax=Galendromus occidentalis TaxID=34638 RepID=A0AAJ7L8G9_9ACAR|nr:adenosine kinase isoform X2 [Galendromus occidentalis]